MRWLVCIHLRDDEAAHVVQQSVRWATPAGAKLDLLFVQEPTVAPTWVSAPLSALVYERPSEQMRVEEGVQLERLRQHLPENVRGRALYVEGRPGDEILKRAASGDYRLVTLAGRRHSAVSRVLLGSVAVNVARHSDIPVLIIPSRDHGAPPRDKGELRGVFGVDLRSSNAGTGLDEGTLWSSLFHSRLDLAHIDPSRQKLPFIDDPDVRHRFEQEWQAFREYDIGRLRVLLDRLPASVRGVPRLEEGAPAEGIAALAEEYDWIAIATHGRTGLTRWFLGSVAERVLQMCTRPVLLLRAHSTTHPSK